MSKETGQDQSAALSDAAEVVKVAEELSKFGGEPGQCLNMAMTIVAWNRDHRATRGAL